MKVVFIGLDVLSTLFIYNLHQKEMLISFYHLQFKETPKCYFWLKFEKNMKT